MSVNDKVIIDSDINDRSDKIVIVSDFSESNGDEIEEIEKIFLYFCRWIKKYYLCYYFFVYQKIFSSFWLALFADIALDIFLWYNKAKEKIWGRNHSIFFKLQ